ncbi:hypothetical protein AVEN_259878-1 [Araneus ventricosus]|uniref:Uncharacterized protein n=1 Tax=Araneus ventricosus TaxID=182803 RepID=A0A4Y2TE85_ARAVE|nr:hypothetical protein AVEN_259878-1 [Araneus ventricosus]
MDRDSALLVIADFKMESNPRQPSRGRLDLPLIGLTNQPLLQTKQPTDSYEGVNCSVLQQSVACILRVELLPESISTSNCEAATRDDDYGCFSLSSAGHQYQSRTCAYNARLEMQQNLLASIV